MPTTNNHKLAQLLHAAWKTGHEIVLDGIGYGRIHWGDMKKIKTTPGPHYYLLAGFVNNLSATRICEIGTHCAGSTLAMQRGIKDQENSLIVTLDITRESNKYLRGKRHIEKIVGDANREKQVKKVLEKFGGAPIDILFIDGDHKFVSVMLNYGIYTALLRPKYVFLDDITLNGEMRRAWSYIKNSVPEEDAVNVVDLIPEVRPGNPGFGCVRLRQNQ